MLGSVNTVKSYIDYLETGWLFFTVNKYAYSVKTQQIAPKKIYAVDTGLVRSLAFSFSKNTGKLLENLVFLTLRRKTNNIYYYKTEKGQKLDFFLPLDKKLIQVCQDITNEETIKRETSALFEAMRELKINTSILITENEKKTIKEKGCTIEIVPIVEWLLNK